MSPTSETAEFKSDLKINAAPKCPDCSQEYDHPAFLVKADGTRSLCRNAFHALAWEGAA